MRKFLRKVFRPGRDVRYKSAIMLPDGNTVNVDLNVSAHLRELIRAQSAAILAAQNWMEDEEDDQLREVFYDRFTEFLTVILGKRNYDDALKAYDFHREELCRQFDHWAATEIIPKVHEASDLQVTRLKALSRAYDGK